MNIVETLELLHNSAQTIMERTGTSKSTCSIIFGGVKISVVIDQDLDEE